MSPLPADPGPGEFLQVLRRRHDRGGPAAAGAPLRPAREAGPLDPGSGARPGKTAASPTAPVSAQSASNGGGYYLDGRTAVRPAARLAPGLNWRGPAVIVNCFSITDSICPFTSTGKKARRASAASC